MKFGQSFLKLADLAILVRGVSCNETGFAQLLSSVVAGEAFCRFDDELAQRNRLTAKNKEVKSLRR